MLTVSIAAIHAAPSSCRSFHERSRWTKGIFATNAGNRIDNAIHLLGDSNLTLKQELEQKLLKLLLEPQSPPPPRKPQDVVAYNSRVSQEEVQLVISKTLFQQVVEDDEVEVVEPLPLVAKKSQKVVAVKTTPRLQSGRPHRCLRQG